MHLCAILFLSFLITISTNKINRQIIETFSESRGGFFITLFFGEQLKNQSYLIDLLHPYTFELNKPIVSKSLSLENITIKNEAVPACLYQEDIKFPSSGFETSFYFYYIEFQPKAKLQYQFSTISLSLSQNTTHSIVHDLYQRGIISERSFSFMGKYIIENYSQGLLYFGAVPENKLPSMTCKVEPGYNDWGCFLKTINVIIDTRVESFQVNKFTFFGTKESILIVPDDFFNFISEKVLLPFLKEKKCRKLNFKEYQHIECQCRVVDSVLFYFNFENQENKIINVDLFERYGNQCVFMVENRKDIPEWTFGTSFLRKFISSFNYDERRVTLYSKKIINNQNETNIIGNEKNKNVCKIIFFFGNFILIINSVILIYLNRIIYINKKK